MTIKQEQIPSSAVCHEKYLKVGRKFGADAQSKPIHARLHAAYAIKKKIVTMGAILFTCPMSRMSWTRNQVTITAAYGLPLLSVIFVNRSIGPNIPSLDMAYKTLEAPIKHDKAAENDDNIIPMNIIGGLIRFYQDTRCLVSYRNKIVPE